MTITSAFDIDNSAVLAKRFAEMVAGDFAAPQGALSAVSIPLENLFRLLEMARYGAWGDGHEHGDNWHVHIEVALVTALSESFRTVPQDAAIDELQHCMRALCLSQACDSRRMERSRKFFALFASLL